MTHGARAHYLRGCRCQPCGDANRQYVKWYKLDHGRGHRRRTTVTPNERARMVAMHDAGWSWQAIADIVGCSESTAQAAALEEFPNVSRKVKAGLANLDWGNYPDTGSGVPSVGTTRRLQALAFMGHSLPVLSVGVGMAVANTQKIQSGRQPRVRGLIAISTQRLYDDLWATPGPSQRSRNVAANRGYAPPLAWDDGTIDDPAARPNTGTKVSGYGTRKLPDADQLAAEVNGASVAVVAERYEVARRSVAKALRRAGYRAVVHGHEATYVQEEAA